VKNIIVLPFAAFMALAAAAPALAEQVPAGYIMSIDLHGEDQSAKTAILREGKELTPKLMMPLYEKDVVFLRDPESKIAIETGGGEAKEVTGKDARFEVTGEVETGDDAWSLIAAVAGVIGGEEEEAVPDNMASRGDENELKIPMAVRGPNFITTDMDKMWLAWSGGKAPYKVIVDVDGRAKSYDKIRLQEIEFESPPDEAKRFTVTVKDSEGRIANVVMRYRNSLPTPNEGFKGELPGGDAKDIAYAAWMTSLHEGDWTIGAAQLLRALPDDNTQAKLLLAKIVEGWKYQD
jgi:hypothetical protein